MHCACVRWNILEQSRSTYYNSTRASSIHFSIDKETLLMRFTNFCIKLTWHLLHNCRRVHKSTLSKYTGMHGGIRTLNNMAAKLRLVQFACKDGGERRVGVELQDRSRVVDITAVDSKIPKDMRSFLETWDASITAARELVTHLSIHYCTCCVHLWCHRLINTWASHWPMEILCLPRHFFMQGQQFAVANWQLEKNAKFYISVQAANLTMFIIAVHALVKFY